MLPRARPPSRLVPRAAHAARGTRGRRLRLLAAVSALVLLVTGCSVFEPDAEPTGLSTSSDTSPPAGSEELDRFYGQSLDWRDCPTGPGQCAELTVPMDWSEPDGKTIEVGVYRAQATGKSSGSLVVNPGGPGASGVNYAAAADSIVGEQIRDNFDIVGFDPRGVGLSHAVDCLTDPELDDFLGQDPTPDDAGERREAVANAEEFADKCEQRVGGLLGHISTIDVAKDMDVLRSALGDAKLNYLGKSYGTHLGTVYAENFPEKVGRMVLDGAVAPDLTTLEYAQGQAKGFDRATKVWAEDCVDQGCSLGSSVTEVTERVEDLLGDLDAEPVSGSGGLELTEGWATLGIAQAMYDEGQWSQLTEAILAAEGGDGSGLMDLAMRYANRDASGGYTSNLMESFRAISCLDRAPKTEAEDWQDFEQEVAEAAPMLGANLAWEALPCAVWPEDPPVEPQKVDAKGADPILVVGTTRDPATPYAWSQRLDEQLDSSSLLTYEGDGHTAYMRGSDCVDEAVDEFWMTGEVPTGDALICD